MLDGTTSLAGCDAGQRCDQTAAACVAIVPSDLTCLARRGKRKKKKVKNNAMRDRTFESRSYTAVQNKPVGVGSPRTLSASKPSLS